MAAVRIATLMTCLLCSPVVSAAQTSTGTDTLAAGSAEKIEQLEKRIRDLEQTRAAQEEATRSIIRQTIERSGTMINNVASFGGVFEMVAGKSRNFAGVKDHFMKVNAMEFAFDVQLGEWTLGSFIAQYTDGSDQLFPTADGTELGVPRFDLDTGWLTIGDTQRFPLYATFGRQILPFGISTGDPVADVPTLEDPLTIEGFEMREDAILIGAGLPTPAPTPTVSVLAPPSVKPKVFRPLFGGLAHVLGYRPPPAVRTEPAVVERVSPPPPLTLGVLWYNGTTVDRAKPNTAWYPGQHFGLTAGYRTTGPRAFDFTVDYNSSVFESRFLESEYRGFLDEIGLVPGMAASLKGKWGPVGFVTEWNGAVKKAHVVDDRNRPREMTPRAWQVGAIYQLGWNSGVEALGAQGTYVAVDYSQTLDLSGITSIPAGLALRVGALPQKRFLLTVGEWVLDGVRVSFEYSYIKDYPTTDRGTGQSGNGVAGMITYDW
jgi:hypothetical protein